MTKSLTNLATTAWPHQCENLSWDHCATDAMQDLLFACCCSLSPLCPAPACPQVPWHLGLPLSGHYLVSDVLKLYRYTDARIRQGRETWALIFLRFCQFLKLISLSTACSEFDVCMSKMPNIATYKCYSFEYRNDVREFQVTNNDL